MSQITSQIFNREADQLIADLIAEYDKLGLRASGNFAKSLRKEVTNTRMTIYGPPYADQMQNGRRPTMNEGDGSVRERILEWIRIKPITPSDPKTTVEQLAFLIARKIHRDGITVPNQYNPGGVISNVITEDRINEIIKKVRFAEVEEIKSEIFSLFTKAKA